MKIVRLEDMKKSDVLEKAASLKWAQHAPGGDGREYHSAHATHGRYNMEVSPKGRAGASYTPVSRSGKKGTEVHIGRGGSKATVQAAALAHHTKMSAGAPKTPRMSKSLSDFVKSHKADDVIGTTESGKAIKHGEKRKPPAPYVPVAEAEMDADTSDTAARHKNFTKEDHEDAAEFHSGRAGRISKLFYGDHGHAELLSREEKKRLRDQQDHHYTQASCHRRLSYKKTTAVKKSEARENAINKGETHMSKSNASSIDDIFKGEDNEEIKVIEVEMDGETISVPLSEVQKSLEALKNGEVHKAQSVAKDNKKGRKTVGHGGQEKEPRANGAGAGRPTPTTDKTIKADEEGSDDEKATKAAACKSCGKAGDLCKCSHTGKMKKGEETQEPLVKALGGSEAVMYVENNTSLGDRAVAEMIAKSNGLGQGIIDSIRNPQMEKR